MASDLCYCSEVAPDLCVACEVGVPAVHRAPLWSFGTDKYGHEWEGAVVVRQTADLIGLLRLRKRAGWREFTVTDWFDRGELVAAMIDHGSREFQPILYGTVVPR